MFSVDITAALTFQLSPLNFGGKFRKLSPADLRPHTSHLTPYMGQLVVPVLVISHQRSPTPGSTPLSLSRDFHQNFHPSREQQGAAQHVRIWRENTVSGVWSLECWDIDSWGPSSAWRMTSLYWWEV